MPKSLKPDNSYPYDAEKIRGLLRNCPAILYACDIIDSEGSDDRFMPKFVSENIRTKFGFDAAECLGDPDWWINRLHPDDKKAALSKMQELIDKGHVTHEYRFKRKDGNYRWIRDELRLFVDPSGNPKQIIGSWTDITDRKEVEIELEANRQLLKNIVATVPNIIYIFDPYTNKVKFLNRIDLGITGYNENELKEMYNDFFNRIIYPEDAANIKRELEHWIKNQDQEELSFEYRVKTKNGNLRWLASMNRVFERDPDGQVKQIVGAAWDITELKQAYEMLESKRIALQEVLASVELEKMQLRNEVSLFIQSEIIPLVDKITAKEHEEARKYCDLLKAKLNSFVFKDESLSTLLSKLTSREYEICILLSEGADPEEISGRLGISEGTLKKHRENIRKKLNLTNRSVNLVSYLKEVLSH